MGDNKYGQCGTDRKIDTFVATPTLAKQNKKDPLFCNLMHAGFQYGLVTDSRLQ